VNGAPVPRDAALHQDDDTTRVSTLEDYQRELLERARDHGLEGARIGDADGFEAAALGLLEPVGMITAQSVSRRGGLLRQWRRTRA
jgi:hypothetical protein